MALKYFAPSFQPKNFPIYPTEKADKKSVYYTFFADQDSGAGISGGSVQATAVAVPPGRL